MVLTRINLKLIKCDFLLDFIFFSFFERNKKKYFSLWHLICSFEKKNGDMIYEKFKKQKNAQKKSLSSTATWIAFLAWKTLKFGFLYFYKSHIALNFLSKIINSESIGILNYKLWPKYETGVEDNTNSALSSIFSQNFEWGSTSNLSKLI